MSAADIIDEDAIEIPENLTAALDSCRRLVANPKADKPAMFERGATGVFRSVTKEDGELWQFAINTLYDIGYGIGLDDTAGQEILDAALAKSFALPPEQDPIQQAWERNDPRNKGQANGHDAAPTPETDNYGTTTAQLPATIDRPTRELKLNDPADYAGKEIPPREWLALHRIPAGKPTLLSGDGGTGKTTIALQLLVAVAYGDEWLGARIDKQGPAWFISAEEDNDEIIRRLTAILDHQGRTLEDLKGRGVRWTCLDDENEYGDSDALLGVVDRTGRVQKTPLYDALLKLAIEQRPAFIGIENAADVFAIDENNRSQVRQSVALLRRLAKRSGAAVMLNTHPSLYGLNSGGGTSGSTQWSNAVRSRLYFAAAKKTDDEETDIRELRVMKANYGPSGEAVRLCWRQGLFVPAGSTGTLERVSAETDIDQAYLDCLDTAAARFLEVGESPGRAYAPAVFEKMPQARGFKSKALAAAQTRLFTSGRIEVQLIGRFKSDMKPRIVRKLAP
jgi:RecA-family ATPase